MAHDERLNAVQWGNALRTVKCPRHGMLTVGEYNGSQLVAYEPCERCLKENGVHIQDLPVPPKMWKRGVTYVLEDYQG